MKPDGTPDHEVAQASRGNPGATSPALPPAILMHVAADGGGQVVLVTGAGCSMPAPTRLNSGAAYSLEAHERLVLDGVMGADACSDPSDLSELADYVFEVTGSQRALTDRLPRAAWRNATPNDGHLIAAALLIEGVLRCVVTLNYDLALQTSLAMLGSPPEVSICRGPEDHARTGGRALVFLHRSVEASEDDWVLRKSALDEAWRDGWEEMIAAGALSAPLTLFAGLGSPAAVLTETVSRLAGLGGNEYYLVDPYPDNKFRAAIGDNLTGVVELGWVQLMTDLSNRVIAKQAMVLRTALAQVAIDLALTAPTCLNIDDFLRGTDVVSVGRLRASWALHPRDFMPDCDESARRALAHLLLAVFSIAEKLQASVEVESDGAVRLSAPGHPDLYFQCGHGGGTRTEESVRARVEERQTPLTLHSKPRVLLTAGALPQVHPLPTNLVYEEAVDDLVRGADTMVLVSFEEIQATCLDDAQGLRERLHS